MNIKAGSCTLGSKDRLLTPRAPRLFRVHLDNFNTRRITEALHAGVLTKDFAHKNRPTTFASDGSAQATSVPRGKDETDENGHVVKLFNTYLLVPGRDAMAR